MARARLAVITDSHLCSPDTPYGHWNDRLLLPESWALWREAVDAVAGSDAEAVLLLGDLTNFAETGLLVRGLRELARAGRPIVAVAGNHDVGPSGDALAGAAATLASSKETGPPPTAPELTVPGLTVSPSPAFGGFHIAGVPIRADGQADGQGGHVLAGQVLDRLPGGLPLIVVSHYPVIDIEPDLLAQRLKHPDHLGGLRPLRRQLDRHQGPVIILHGHVHRHHAARRGHILQLSMAPLIENPHAVTLLTLREDPAGLSAERETVPLRAAPKTSRAPEHWMYQNGRWALTTSPAKRFPP
jgi:DNA repair exonuclease